MKRFEGRVAIVTGSSSGIGRETAIQFAREGASVVISARRVEKLEEVKKIIEDEGGKVVCVGADVNKLEDCVRIVDAAISNFGKVDILVNNAGVVDKHKPITRTDYDWWEEVLHTDLTSLFYMTKEVLKYMEPAHYGRIINISSIGGVFGNSGVTYSSAKSGVIGMTKNIAIQFAGEGITCNAVCPGPTATEINLPERIATYDAEFAKKCNAGMNFDLPFPEVEDQANTILFFADEKCGKVTGQVIVVDGGVTL